MKTTGNTLRRGSDGRGQTTQDFAVGISIFLLTVGFTFGFLPSLLSPFGSPLGDDITAKSDRVAETIIDDHLVEGELRTLDDTELDNFLTNNPTDADLRAYFGLRASADVNVTVMNVHDDGTRTVLVGPASGDEMSAGDEYGSQTSAASTTRVVVVESGQCDVECLLVVRVW
ncbi:DUF7287 family protein [Haloarchaeobius sp. HRN-SO-5]|uniref:DUF7287 family protein n=1 Tax=Haloarchaeobius sp. HRN-SO-5 TaxID=3446118 RepID=UPI003EBE1121